MKRYDSDEEGVMRESKDGMWNLHSDLSAHMLKLKEMVAFLSCRNDCASAKWVPYNQDALPCDCPRGQALRLIEEVL